MNISTGEPVRWGCLGCARVFEKRMVPGFAAAENAVLVGVASRTKEKAQETAAKHGIPKSFDSYDALLADSDIEAVYIPLPNDQHAEWSIRALQAGKHVLCDKPAALSYADALRMREAAQTANRHLLEGFMFRYHPQHLRAKKIMDSGEIGEVVHFRGAFTYPAVPAPGGIRWITAHGGGALYDVAVYPVNAARFYMQAEPIAVSAVAVPEASCGVDNHTTALLEFDGGRTAYILGGFDQVFTTQLEVVGRKGVLSCSRAFQIGENGVSVTVRCGDSDVRTETFPHMDQYRLEIEQFSDCIRHPEKQLAPGEDGAAQARVVEAICRSAAEKRRILLSEIA